MRRDSGRISLTVGGEFQKLDETFFGTAWRVPKMGRFSPIAENG
jgi:hypothetical protein